MFRIICFIYGYLLLLGNEHCFGMYVHVPYTSVQKDALECARELCDTVAKKNSDNSSIRSIYQKLQKIQEDNADEIYDCGEISELVALCLERFKDYNNE